jgi:hypothetical protein
MKCCGSVTFWYGSGSGFGSGFCSFCLLPFEFFTMRFFLAIIQKVWYHTLKPATDAIFELWTALWFYLIMACSFYIHVKLFFTNLYPYIFYYSVNFAFPCNIPSKVQNSSIFLHWYWVRYLRSHLPVEPKQNEHISQLTKNPRRASVPKESWRRRYCTTPVLCKIANTVLQKQ